MNRIGITEETFNYIVESVYNEIVKNNKLPSIDIDKIKLDYAEMSEHVLSKIPIPENGKDYILTDKDISIISDKIKKTLPDHTNLKSEIITEIESKKFDNDDLGSIAEIVQSKINLPEQKLDSTEIIKGLLDTITTSEEQKRIDFYKDEVFSDSIKSALSKQVLDQIELPKDGEKGDQGERGEPGESAQSLPLTEKDKKEIASFVDISKLIKDRKKDLVLLIEQLKTGKIKLPSHAGIDVKEIINEISKILGSSDWKLGSSQDVINVVIANLNQSVLDVDSATATLDGSKYFIGVSYTVTGSCIVTLPTITASLIGAGFTVADTGANATTNNITINRASTNTIISDSLDETSVIINTDGSVLRFLAINETTWKVY